MTKNADNKITLSFTTINNLYRNTHSYLNWVMKIKAEETEAMRQGKIAHEKLQNHVTGRQRITGIDLDLDFTSSEYFATAPFNEKYNLRSYLDAVNFKSKTALEIKTVTNKVWTNGQFDNSVQPAFYSYVTKLRKFYLLSCKFDLSNMKIYYREFNEENDKKVVDWVNKAIEIIETHDLKEDLIGGRCNGWCGHGKNCYFYNL